MYFYFGGFLFLLKAFYNFMPTEGHLSCNDELLLHEKRKKQILVHPNLSSREDFMVCKALRLRENTVLKFLCKFLYFQYCCFF